ncbi:MAG: hypothetical protein ONB05_07225, partial [candidate division KSB1 bacterium]|nr:hypothetical protein [candidate division KSB1 bacterium]
MKLALKSQLLIGRSVFLLVLLLSAGVVFYIINYLSRTTEQSIQLLNSTSAVGDEIVAAVFEQLIAGEEFLLTGSAASRQKFSQAGSRAYQNEVAYLKLNLTLAERLQVEKIKALHAEMEVLASEAFTLSDIGDRPGAVTKMKQVLARGSDLEQEVEKIMHMEAVRIRDTSQKVRDFTLRAGWLLIGFLLLAALVDFLFVLIVTTRSIIAPIRELVQGTDKIRKG